MTTRPYPVAPDAVDAPNAAVAPSRGRGLRALAIAVGVVILAAALRLGQPVFVPLVVGLFLAVLAHPLYAGLRARLPKPLRWLAIVVAMLAVLAGLLAFLALLGWTARAVLDDVMQRRDAIDAQLGELRALAARFGVTLPTGEAGGGEAAGAGGEGGGGAGSFAQRILGATASTLAGLGLALGFTALGLAEASEVRRRLARLHGAGRRALDAVGEAAPVFRRYVWVKTLTSAITGAATALAALAFGLPLWWAWGVIAFLLEYVPSVGSVLAVFPPVLMALADGGPRQALLVLLVIGAIQVTLGNVVDPRIEGRLMRVSPFGVLLSIVVWGWLWGAAGALLAVPLTVALVVASRHVPGGGGFATLVAGDGVPDDDADREGAARG